jgi:spore maturation protein CgeB
MRVLYFTHSLRSCWNHGNAHFLRGVMKELLARGHDVQAFEPRDAWSATNLTADQGKAALRRFENEHPALAPAVYSPDSNLSSAVDGADLVLVHEWNEPWLIAALGRLRRDARFVLLFHDTHHRAVSDPVFFRRMDLADYDGVLAFGESLARIYRARGWGRRVFVWHEAADTTLFHPPSPEQKRSGLVWIGNWGDGERSEELRSYLLEPSRDLRIPLDMHGVRYPAEALAALTEHGASYRGWIANADVPASFARHVATVHVPRRFYVETLPGIPTIRVFEALACGIPLVCAQWDDSEGLFRPGRDYLVARSGEEMRRHLQGLVHDPGLRQSLVAHGLKTIARGHSCAHRVDELLAIVESLRMPAVAA